MEKKQNNENIYDKVNITVGMLNVIITVGIMLTVVLVAVSCL